MVDYISKDPQHWERYRGIGMVAEAHAHHMATMGRLDRNLHLPAMNHELKLPGREACSALCAVSHHSKLDAASLVSYGCGLRDGVEVAGDRLGDVEFPGVSVVQDPFLQPWWRSKGWKGGGGGGQ